MPANRTKESYYGVKIGRNPGVYHTWTECQPQTAGFPNAQYQKFSTQQEAEKFVFGDPSDLTDIASSSAAFGPEWDVVYAAGVCKSIGDSGDVAGLGVWWGTDDTRNLAEKCPGMQTGKCAELMSILRLLETTGITMKPLLIRTDSEYFLDCFKNKINTWKENNWRDMNGLPVEHASIIRCIAKYLEIRSNYSQEVIIAYVKPFQFNTGNDGAKALANIGASASSPRDDLNREALEEILECQLNQTMLSLKRKIVETQIIGPDGIHDKVLIEMRTKADTVNLVGQSTGSPSKYVSRRG